MLNTNWFSKFRKKYGSMLSAGLAKANDPRYYTGKSEQQIYTEASDRYAGYAERAEKIKEKPLTTKETLDAGLGPRDSSKFSNQSIREIRAHLKEKYRKPGANISRVQPGTKPARDVGLFPKTPRKTPRAITSYTNEQRLIKIPEYAGKALKSWATEAWGKTMGDIGYAFYDTLDEKPSQKDIKKVFTMEEFTLNPIKIAKTWLGDTATIGEGLRYMTLGQIFKHTKVDEEIAADMKKFSAFYEKELMATREELGIDQMSSADPRKIGFNVGMGGGYLALAVAITVATKNPNAGAFVLSVMESSGEYTAARDAGKSPNEAMRVYVASGAGTFISEKVGMDFLLKKMHGGMATQFIKHGAIEAMQETSQTWWQNYVAREGYEEGRSIFEGTVDTIIASFILGALGGGGIQASNNNKAVVGMNNEAIAMVRNRLGMDEEEATGFIDYIAKKYNEVELQVKDAMKSEEGFAKIPTLKKGKDDPQVLNYRKEIERIRNNINKGNLSKKDKAISIKEIKKMEGYVSKIQGVPRFQIKPEDRTIQTMEEVSGKYQVVEVAPETGLKNISNTEALQIVKAFPWAKDLPVRFVDSIVTAEGQLAYGKWENEAFTFINNTREDNPKHEAFHGGFDILYTPEQQQEYLDIVKAQSLKDINNDEAHEILARGFSKFKNAQQTGAPMPSFPQKIMNFFQELWNALQSITGNRDNIKKLYKSIYTDVPSLGKKAETVKKKEHKKKSDAKFQQALKKAKLTMDSIIKKLPDINLKRDVNIRDIYGNKHVLKKGEAFTPYELVGNKYALKDGQTYILQKGQFENVMASAVVAGKVGKKAEDLFLQDLHGTEETILGAEDDIETMDSFREDADGGWYIDGYDYSIDYHEDVDEWVVSDGGAEMNTFEELDEAKSYLLDTMKEIVAGHGGPQYSQYVEDGGENYREVLIQAPEVRKTVWSAKRDKETPKEYEKIAKKVEKLTGLDREKIGGGEIEEAGGSKALVDKWYDVMIPVATKEDSPDFNSKEELTTWITKNWGSYNKGLDVNNREQLMEEGHFQGSHYDGQENIIAWLRLNDRRYVAPGAAKPDTYKMLKALVGERPFKVYLNENKEHIESFKTKGEALEFIEKFKDTVTAKQSKVLFSEEFQSDWMKAVRTWAKEKATAEGKKGKEAKTRANELIRGFFENKGFIKSETEIRKELGKTLEEKRNIAAQKIDGVDYSEMNKDRKEMVDKYIKEYMGDSIELTEALSKNKADVPYSEKLEGWLDLAIKRGLKEAVENKYDYFAWTNGEQQKGRYNLSQEVEEIKWGKSETIATAKRVSIELKNNSFYVLDVNKSGVVENAVGSKSTELMDEDLEKIVGKAVADKILKDGEGKLEGEGLDIGGQWADNLYNKRIGKRIQEMTGQPQEEIDLGIKEKRSPVAGDTDNPWAKSMGTMALAPMDISLGVEIRREDNYDDRFIVIEVLSEDKTKFNIVSKDLIEEKIDSGEYDIGEAPTYQKIHKALITPKVLAKIKALPGIEEVDLSLYIKPLRKDLQPAIKITPQVIAVVKSMPIPIEKASGEAPLPRYQMVEDYQGVHEAPRGSDGFSQPAHKLGDMYPEDIYSANGARYYGDGSPFDQQSINIIHSLRDKPDAKVTIYRAVPKILTIKNKKDQLEKDMAHVQKKGTVPNSPFVGDFQNSDFYEKYGTKARQQASAYYNWAAEEVENLADDKKEEVKIISGDWVTMTREYAVVHGKSNLNGHYKILQKTVKASEVFSEGNSIHEWGYEPKAKYQLIDDDIYPSELEEMAKVDKKETPLEAEARKYKTAEEFVSGFKKNEYTGATSIKMDLDTSILKTSETVEKAIPNKVKITDPIGVIYNVDTNTYKIQNGHHRFAQAIANNQQKIPSQVVYVNNQNANNLLSKSQLTDIWNKVQPKYQKKKTKPVKQQLAEREELKKARARAKEKRDSLRFYEEDLDYQYEAWKKLKNKRVEDATQLKKKNRNVPEGEIDNMLYSQNMGEDEVFNMFMDRYELERMPLPKVPKLTRGMISEMTRQGIRTDKQISKSRVELIRAVQKQFALSDNDLKKITRKDVRLMKNYEFKQHLDYIRQAAVEMANTRQAKNELIDTQNRMELQKEENYRNAKKLPPISKMTIKQLEQYMEALEQFEVGDEFLTQRQLEVVDRTNLKGIHTVREARERLLIEMNKRPGYEDVELKDLQNIKSGAIDLFSIDTGLAEKNPFYNYIITRAHQHILIAEANFLDVQRKTDDLANKARKSRKRGIVGGVKQFLAPQYEEIINYLEAPVADKASFAEKLTKEELDYAYYVQQYYTEAYNHLIQIKELYGSRFVEQYFTHTRKMFLEQWIDNGLISAIKNAWQSNKEDQLIANIIDQDTGEILPKSKFFQYTLQRTGELDPSKNLTRVFLQYARMFERKKMFDQMIPELDIYTSSLAPRELTPRGLEMDRSLKKFVNTYLNNKKGRRHNFGGIIKQNGPADIFLKIGNTFVSLKDLAFNIFASVAATIGEQVMTYQTLGKIKYIKAWKRRLFDTGAKRLLDPNANKILKDNEAFIGRNIWTELAEADKGFGERNMQVIFGMFAQSSVEANKLLLLGSLTKKELKSGKISTERLAELKLEGGRWRDMGKDFDSIFGSTSVGKAVFKYKGWALPILRTTAADLKHIASSLKKGKFKELKGKEAQEIARAIEMSFVIFTIGAMLIGEDDDETFLGKLKARIYMEAMTFLGGIDPTLFLSTPRLYSFLQKLADNIMMIVKLEEYETTTKWGEEGDLKGIQALKRQFTPAAVKQFQGEKETPVKTEEDLIKEITEKVKSGEMTKEAAKEYEKKELTKMKTAATKARRALPQEEYRAEIARLVQSGEMTKKEAKQDEEKWDDAQEKINELKGDVEAGTEEPSLIKKVTMLSKSLFTDPVSTFNVIFTDEKIRKLENGTVIFARGKSFDDTERIDFSLEERKERGANKGDDMRLDHTIPLELGGDNGDDNLKLVSKEEWARYTPIENYLGALLRNKEINEKEARKAILDFKNGKTTEEEVRSMFGSDNLYYMNFANREFTMHRGQDIPYREDENNQKLYWTDGSGPLWDFGKFKMKMRDFLGNILPAFNPIETTFEKSMKKEVYNIYNVSDGFKSYTNKVLLYSNFNESETKSGAVRIKADKPYAGRAGDLFKHVSGFSKLPKQIAKLFDASPETKAVEVNNYAPTVVFHEFLHTWFYANINKNDDLLNFPNDWDKAKREYPELVMIDEGISQHSLYRNISVESYMNERFAYLADNKTELKYIPEPLQKYYKDIYK